MLITTKFILKDLIPHRKLWDPTHIIDSYLIRYTDMYENINPPLKSVKYSFAFLSFVEWFEGNVIKNILRHSESLNVWSSVLIWLIF